MEKLSKKEITYILIAVAVIIIGLKFTSVGSGPGNSIQNDGYNVTGGIIAMIGGLMIGLVLGRRKK